MATLRQLLQSTQRFKPALFINADTVSVQSLTITRSKGVRTILFSAQTKDTDSPSGRTAQMQFVIPKEEVENIEDYKPSISKDRVLVRTSSPWYRFAFQYNNQRLKAQFGKIKPFTVSGKGRPVNPKNQPGLDKHLIALLRALKDEGLVRG